MAYSEVSDIESDFKDIEFLAAAATPTSLVTEEDVDQFITEADALINSYLSMRYETPVTGGSEALELLKLYSRSLVASRIKGIMQVKQATNTDANQNVREGLSTKDVLKLLEDLRDNKTSLTGATLLAVSGLFYSKNYANQVCPTMKKGTKQW
jgi:hypothetical protein